MQDNLNVFLNVRQPDFVFLNRRQPFFKGDGKLTSSLRAMEDDLNFLQMEDALNLLANGRRLINFFKKPQCLFKWKTTILLVGKAGLASTSFS